MPKTKTELLEGVAHLILDDPDEKLNTLGAELLAELTQRIGELGKDPAVKAIVIQSAKEGGFIAGANIRELQAIALGPVEAAYAGGLKAAQVGQALMDLIEDCPKPVVVAVHGAALGGGLELALAAHARVVSDDASTKLGLPELKLGIMPGFGGTLRLPREIGLARAVPAILASSNFDGKKAYKNGLADIVCPKEYIVEQAHKLALSLLDPGALGRLRARRRSTLPLFMRLLELPGLREIIFSQARKEVLAKTGGHYPAPLRCLDHMATNLGKSRADFMQAEAESLANCLATPVAQNLVRVFFLSQDAKKQMGDAKPKRPAKVAVVGAGFMGSGIAVPLVTRAGIPTYLKDSNEEVLGRAQKKLWDGLFKRVSKRQLTEREAREQFLKATPVRTDFGLRDAGLVIEAVPEILDLKRKIFADLEAVLGPEVVLASNTSTLPIGDIAAQAKHPERFIGMHFFSPAELMPLVEVIPSKHSSPQTIATVVDLALKMGKTPVVVKDSPGFLVNRILMPYILEAAQLVQEGVPVAKVDAAALKFGMPVGPIKLMGEVGIPVITKVYHILKEHFGDHLPSPAWLEHAELEKAFSKDAAGKLSVDHQQIEAWAGKADPGYTQADLTDRLFQAMLNEAARCLDEGIVPQAGFLDLAMIFGTGFPPFRGGLLREADARGLANVLVRSRVLAQKAPHLAAPTALEAAAARGAFYTA